MIIGRRIILLLTVWWFFWLLVSMFSLTGLNAPSFKAFTFSLGFIISFNIGAKLIFFNKIKLSKYFYKKICILSAEKIFKKLFFVFLLVMLPLALIAFMALQSMTPEEYRMVIFKSSDEGGALLGNDLFNLIYMLVIKPLIWIFIGYGLWIYANTGKNIYLLLSFLVGSLDALIFLGRFFFYEFIVATYITSILTGYSRQNLQVKESGFLKKIVTISIVNIIIFTYLTNKETYIYDFFYKFIIDYHTIGFIFFSNELDDVNSFSNSNIGFGSGALIALYRYFALIIHKLIPDWNYPELMEQFAYRNEFVLLSNDGDNSNVYNAYYTVLTTLYYDGGLFGIVIGGLIMGYMLNKYICNYQATRSPINFIMIILMTQMVFFSIFQSRIESLMVQIFFLYSISFFSKNMFGYK